VELWTLMLNGVAVPESQDGFPPDSELLNKTMQPGQRQIFRLVNASANSFLAPELVLSQNGVETVLPLEVFARDGVGLADALGNRHFGYYDVAQQQLIVPPSSRIEFVVHAPPPGAKLYVQSSQVAPGCGGNLYPARRLLLVTPSGTPVNPGATDDSDLLQGTPSLAPYLATLVKPPPYIAPSCSANMAAASPTARRNGPSRRRLTAPTTQRKPISSLPKSRRTMAKSILRKPR
jgi:hypothetical protein